MRRTLIPLALALAAAPSAARAAQRSVSSTSSLVDAIRNARPGDVISVNGGTYSVNLDITRDGTSSSPITLRADPGETVILRAKDTAHDVIDMIDASHWRLEGLKLRGSRHAMIHIDGGTDIVIRDCEIYDGTKKGIIANADRVTIEGCTIRDIKQPRGGHDTQGIAVWRGSRIRIRDNWITTPGDGVLIGGAGELGVTPTDVRIYRNHFHTRDSWYDDYNVENAIDIKDGEDVVVTDNVIHHYVAEQDDGGVAINVHTIDYEQDGDHIDGVRIERNRIYDVARAISIHARTGPGEDVKFRRNVVYNVLDSHASSDKRAGAIFVGKWDGVTIDHNTFVDVDRYVLQAYDDDLTDLTFRNNILRRSDGLSIQTDDAVVDYTCRYSSDSTGGSHDVVGNQRFVDDAGRDYHLRSTSPCIDKGTTATGLSYLGRRPDMGRYEHTPGDPLMPDEGDAPTPLPRDGRPIDWAATPAGAGPGELGPEVDAETPPDDPSALEEEPSAPPGVDEKEPVRPAPVAPSAATPPLVERVEAPVEAPPSEAPVGAPERAARSRRATFARAAVAVGCSSAAILAIWTIVRRQRR